ncbi:MAG: hypothetical protein ACT4PV_00120 [Planctomycetaceae bacterium]
MRGTRVIVTRQPRVPAVARLAWICGGLLLFVGAAVNAGTVTEPSPREELRQGSVEWAAWKPGAPLPDESAILEQISLLLGREGALTWAALNADDPQSEMFISALARTAETSLDLGALQSFVDKLVAARKDAVDFLLRVGEYFFLGRAFHQVSSSWYRRAWSSADDANKRNRGLWHMRGRSPGGGEVVQAPKESVMISMVRTVVSYLFGAAWIVGAIFWFRARRAETVVS